MISCRHWAEEDYAGYRLGFGSQRAPEDAIPAAGRGFKAPRAPGRALGDVEIPFTSFRTTWARRRARSLCPERTTSGSAPTRRICRSPEIEHWAEARKACDLEIHAIKAINEPPWWDVVARRGYCFIRRGGRRRATDARARPTRACRVAQSQSTGAAPTVKIRRAPPPRARWCALLERARERAPPRRRQRDQAEAATAGRDRRHDGRPAPVALATAAPRASAGASAYIRFRSRKLAPARKP